MIKRHFETIFILACLCMVATSYGLARYAYGLFLPVFRQDLGLSDSQLALIGASSYGSYFIVSLLAIGLSRILPPRLSLGLGGALAVLGMLGVAMSETSLMLLLAVSVAGVSPCLAYMPMSRLVTAHIAPDRQQRAYAFLNSGTSLGVVLSGPIAILFSESWPTAWMLFAAFGLLATLLALAVVPPTAATTNDTAGRFTLSDLTAPGGLGLQGLAFMSGAAISVYWVFSADLVARDQADGEQFERVFWAIVGVAGFLGASAGHIARAIGLSQATRLFLLAVSGSIIILPLVKGEGAILISGAVFGASFICLSAAVGMWAMDIYRANPTAGFGLSFLTLSAGQFVGPMLVGLFIEQLDINEIFIVSALALAILAVAQNLLLSHRLLHKPEPSAILIE